VADISETLKTARRYGSGVLAVKIAEAIKTTRKGSNVAKPVDADAIWITHTPQAYKVSVIRGGLEAAQKKKVALEDDSEALSLIGEEVRLVEPTGPRVKIAGAADLNIAEFLLRQ
jgi:2-C-methyl-D-erythritol 4-phosphate cytidylyltransferase